MDSDYIAVIEQVVKICWRFSVEVKQAFESCKAWFDGWFYLEPCISRNSCKVLCWWWNCSEISSTKSFRARKQNQVVLWRREKLSQTDCIWFSATWLPRFDRRWRQWTASRGMGKSRLVVDRCQLSPNVHAARICAANLALFVRSRWFCLSV